MGMPSVLKELNVYVDGHDYLGKLLSFTPPKLSRKMEAYRAGGMGGSAKVDYGLDDDALKAEWTIGGYMKQLLEQYGAVGVAGVQLRLAQAYQRDDTEEVDAVEIVMRGRHSEIDRGEGKPGEKTEVKVVTQCVYYKETLNGEVLIEIDIMSLKQMIGGVDKMAAIRNAIGM